MKQSSSFNQETLRQRVRLLVETGERVRQGVSEEVSAVVQAAQVSPEGLKGLVRSVMDGAEAGVEQAVPENRASVLREVADGLGDGLQAASEAVRLTLQEASGSGRKYAREEVDRVTREFDSIGTILVRTMQETAGNVKGMASDQTRNLREHAERTWQRIRPSLEAAVTAAREHPLDLGRETLQAGVSATAHAAGALFSEIGRRLDRLGSHLQGKNKPE